MEVLVVDDNQVFRNAITDLLQTEDGIVVVGEAADGKEAIEQVL